MPLSNWFSISNQNKNRLIRYNRNQAVFFYLNIQLLLFNKFYRIPFIDAMAAAKAPIHF